MPDVREIRAAVCHAFGEPLVVERVLLAPPQRDEVRVRVAASAICHSDVTYVSGAWGGDLPAIFGHEASGTVEEVGPGASSLAPGDRVVVGLVRACGACARCRGGEPALCSATFRLDEESPLSTLEGAPIAQGLRCGAFAEEVVVHASQAIPLPADIPMTSACLIACGVMTGFGAIANTAQVPAGSSVVVIGAGGVGLNAVQGAAIAGADPVIVVDVAADKLDRARAFGATHLIDARADDPVAAVHAVVADGADVVVSTAGSATAMEQGLAMARRGGALIVVGMPAGGLAGFDPGALAHDGKRIVGSKLGSARPADLVPRLAALYASGHLRLDELVTGTYALDDIEQAMAAMRAGSSIRNVVVMDR